MTAASFPVPRDLVEEAEQQGRQDWLAALPSMISAVAHRWRLQVGAPFRPGGRSAWVAPARGELGTHLVLKVGWRHLEAEHEADGLRVWNGDGAVRLHAEDAFDDTVALLLERCRPGTLLRVRSESEQDVVLASLLPRLWVDPPAGHPFRTLQQMCDCWATEYEVAPVVERAALDSGLARLGMELLRTLPGTAERAVLLGTDVHAGNILAADREPWLVVDPKPHVGDPTYDPVQHLLNCGRRLAADPEGLVRRMADLLELDGQRLRLWLFARCVQEAPHWPGLAEVARRLAPA